MKKITVAITEEMEEALEAERKKRLLSSVPEVARVIIGEYLSSSKKDINKIVAEAVMDYESRKRPK